MKFIKLFLFFLISTTTLYSATADAGEDKTVSLKKETALDGSGSDGDEYKWTIEEKPEGSEATIENDTSKDDAKLKNATNGTYKIKITVKDTGMRRDEQSDTVTISFSDDVYYDFKYSCGIFEHVISSYDSIKSSSDADEAFDTSSIAYPENQLDGEISCTENGDTSSCNRAEPPLNKLTHTIHETAKTDDETTTELTEIEYGNFNGDYNLHFNPTESYKDKDVKVMILGDVTLKGSNTLTFESGDYFLNSLTFKNPDSSIVLAEDAVVRIFIKNDFTVKKTNFNLNKDGDASDLFIYVESDVVFKKEAYVKAFIYTKGTSEFKDENFELHGGITSEGKITIDNTNAKFYQDDNIQNMGYGECSLCYNEDGNTDDGVQTPYINIGTTLDSVIITENPEESTSMRGSGNKNDTADLSTLNQDGDDTGTDEEEQDDDIYVYTFGDNYPYSGDDRETYFQSSRENEEDDESLVIHSASFVDTNDRIYNVYLNVCSSGHKSGTDGEYLLGSFGAWDPEANEDDEDRNITTKIVDEEFTLMLASIDENGEYQYKKNSDENEETGLVKAAIYKNDDTYTMLSNEVEFQIAEDDDDEGETHIERNFTVASAERNATLMLKICSTYEVKAKEDSNAQERWESTMDDITGSDNADKYYIIYPFEHDNCKNNELKACNFQTDKNENDDPVYHMCPSLDKLAIRPKKFIIETDKKNLKASFGDIFEINATNKNNDNTKDYNISSNKYDFTIETKEQDYPNGNSFVNNFTFINGVGDVNISFSDTGEVNVSVKDVNWSQIDTDDTPADCNGYYICGETNATYIPDHFHFSNVKIYNNNNKIYTYIANDLDNMSANIELNITAQNHDNQRTKNFDDNNGSEVKPLTINFKMLKDANFTKSFIDNEVLNFKEGAYKVEYNASSSTDLAFNHSRKVNNSLNPFVVDDDNYDINLSAISSYDDVDIEDINGEDVAIDANATFLYARTNAPRAIFNKKDDNNVSIFYEVYCSGADCNLSLLPDGSASEYSNDPRWFINTKHTNAEGSFSTISQKDGGDAVTLDKVTKNSITLDYDESKKYPFKTTMQNEASSWLIYNKYNANATKNEFEVEFNRDSSQTSWAGKVELGAGSTKSSATSITNRRSMW